MPAHALPADLLHPAKPGSARPVGSQLPAPGRLLVVCPRHERKPRIQSWNDVPLHNSASNYTDTHERWFLLQYGPAVRPYESENVPGTIHAARRWAERQVRIEEETTVHV